MLRSTLLVYLGLMIEIKPGQHFRGRRDRRPSQCDRRSRCLELYDLRGPGPWRLGARDRTGAHEDVVYERGSGQLLSGTFMDYGMPRADNFPTFAVAFDEIPFCTNSLGVKGLGEAGAVASPPTIVNATLDARQAELFKL